MSERLMSQDFLQDSLPNWFTVQRPSTCASGIRRRRRRKAPSKSGRMETRLPRASTPAGPGPTIAFSWRRSFRCSASTSRWSVATTRSMARTASILRDRRSLMRGSGIPPSTVRRRARRRVRRAGPTSARMSTPCAHRRAIPMWCCCLPVPTT